MCRTAGRAAVATRSTIDLNQGEKLNRPGNFGGSIVRENGAMNKKSNRFSPEVKERAVRLVQEHRGQHNSLWAAVESIAPKMGCSSDTLLARVKRAQIDAGQRVGTTSSDAQRIKELERENKELRRANEILKTASAFFAQAELDRQLKR